MKIVLTILRYIALAFGIILLFVYPTKWLWNWLMPVLFNLTEITFWQALGINVLCGILFKTPYVSSK